MIKAKKEGLVSIKEEYPCIAKKQFEDKYRINQNVESLVNLATWNFANGQFEVSEKQYKKALQIDQDYLPASFWLAYLYEEQKNYEDSLRLYQVVFDKSKSNDVALYIAMIKRYQPK